MLARSHRSRTARAWVVRLAFPLFLLSGCFVLFPLDDYRGSAESESEGGADAIVVDATEAGPVDAFVPFDGRVMFVLDTLLTGADIKGLPGADALCSAAATKNGLPGTYKAWLSDRAQAVKVRFGAAFEAGRAIRLIMPDPARTVVASGLDELGEGGPHVPILVTAAGKTLSVNDAGCVEGGIVWTDTHSFGALVDPAQDCEQWTMAGQPGDFFSVAGVLGRVDAGGAWSVGCGVIDCTTPGYLYCVEQ